MNMHRLSYPAAVSTAALLVLTAATLAGQWTVTNLHVPGTPESRATGVSGAQQVGAADIDGYQAILWTGSPGSWISLTPDGSVASYANGVDNGQQVGWVFADGTLRASLWSSDANSWIDLHPATAAYSEAHGIHNNQQVGHANVGFHDRASLWTGSAASWVNLHPPGPAQDSYAVAVHNGEQVGYVEFIDRGRHASLWTGSAASWVDLHPAGASTSLAYGVYAGKQVGSVNFDAPSHAVMWSGSAASFVDLHPAGAVASAAFAAYENIQVGQVLMGGYSRAAIWHGTADSWQDLSLTLPGPQWQISVAWSIWSDGKTMHIAGWGINPETENTEALLWTASVSSLVCPADVTSNGTVDVDDLIAVILGWGKCAPGACAADANGDGTVDVDDLIAVILAWGACPGR